MPVPVDPQSAPPVDESRVQALITSLQITLDELRDELGA